MFDTRDQILGAKLKVQKIESWIKDVSCWVSIHEELQLGKDYLGKDSQEVNAMVGELKEVQEGLESLNSHAKNIYIYKDVTDLLNGDRGDITYKPILK